MSRVRSMGVAAGVTLVACGFGTISTHAAAADWKVYTDESRTQFAAVSKTPQSLTFVSHSDRCFSGQRAKTSGGYLGQFVVYASYDNQLHFYDNVRASWRNGGGGKTLRLRSSAGTGKEVWYPSSASALRQYYGGSVRQLVKTCKV